MELRHLRAFAAVADERHFGRAAARLHLAQPALSQTVQQLERELGSRLFDRTTRSVDLSEAGRVFERHARAVLDAVDRAEREMAAVRSGARGRVAVGLVGTATYRVLPQVAREVSAALPDVTLDLRGELLGPDLLEGLRHGAIDLAVSRTAGAPDDGVAVRASVTEDLVAALPSSHPAAAGAEVALADLREETFVLHPAHGRSSMHGMALEACGRAGFRPDRVLEVAETSTIAVLVAGGLGVSLVPASVRSLALHGVTYLPLHPGARGHRETVDLHLLARAGDQAPAVEAVARILTAVLDGTSS